jgi:hypothetical protein
MKMSKIQVILLVALSVWSFTMWMGYFDKKNTANIVVVEVEDDTVIEADARKFKALSPDFWTWEAQGRLKLVDILLDDETLTTARLNWKQNNPEALKNLAVHATNLQLKAYGFYEGLKPATIQIIPLRGDANGLYVPTEASIYLNSKMQWGGLPFERFMEVVLHENMHHIMTRGITAMSENDPRRDDFESLIAAAFFHDMTGMANDNQRMYQVNPQELVAYNTQRAGRYAGIMGAGLMPGEMTARMQEIRVMRNKAGF